MRLAAGASLVFALAWVNHDGWAAASVTAPMPMQARIEAFATAAADALKRPTTTAPSQAQTRVWGVDAAVDTLGHPPTIALVPVQDRGDGVAAAADSSDRLSTAPTQMRARSLQNCVDGDMLWNGFMAQQNMPETCDGLDQWAGLFQTDANSLCALALDNITNGLAQYFNFTYAPPAGYATVADVCATSCGSCSARSPSPPSHPTGQNCVDGDMLWNGFMAQQNMPETCDGLDQWAGVFQTDANSLCALALDDLVNGLAQYFTYTPPAGYATVADVCATSCGSSCSARSPSPPSHPPGWCLDNDIDWGSFASVVRGFASQQGLEYVNGCSLGAIAAYITSTGQAFLEAELCGFRFTTLQAQFQATDTAISHNVEGAVYFRDICPATCGECSPPPPPSENRPCVDGDMNWNGNLRMYARNSLLHPDPDVLDGIDESCAGLLSWSSILLSPFSWEIPGSPHFYVNPLVSPPPPPLQGASTFDLLCALPIERVDAFRQWGYVPPNQVEYPYIGSVCARTCGYGQCPPSPPTAPPAAPPPPAECASVEYVEYNTIAFPDDDAEVIDLNMRDVRLQVPASDASPADAATAIDRTRLNVFVPASGQCGSTCVAAYDFARETGINVTVHCWWTAEHTGSSLEGIPRSLIASATEACKCKEHLAAHAGNFFLFGPNQGAFDGIEPANGGIMTALTAARAGGIADVYIAHRTDWVLDPRAVSERVELDDVFEDLTPLISSGLNATEPGGDPPSFNFQSVAPLLRETFLRSGTSIFGLPTGYELWHMVHNPLYLPTVPAVADGVAVSWDELIALLQNITVDRDGDGIIDKPLCVRDACDLGSGMLVITQLVASTIFQVNGPHENAWFDPVTFEPIVDSPGFVELMRVLGLLLNLVDLSEPSCAEPLRGSGMNPYEVRYSTDEDRYHSAAYQFQRGRCVALIGYALNEPVPSPTTSVGSPNVALDATLGRTRFRNNESFVPCTIRGGVCPRGVPLRNDPSVTINPVAPYLSSVTFNAIDKRSLLKTEAWRFVSYLMRDEVLAQNFVTGLGEPTVLNSHGDSNGDSRANRSQLAQVWRRFVNSTAARQDSPDERDRPLVDDLNLRSLSTAEATLRKWQRAIDTGLDLEHYLRSLEIEMRNPTLNLRAAMPGETHFARLFDSLQVFPMSTYSLSRDQDRYAAIRVANDGALDLVRAALPRRTRQERLELEALKSRYRKLLGLSSRSLEPDALATYTRNITLCPPGFYKRSILSSTCEACPAGYYASTSTYSPNATCIMCPPNTYNSRVAMLECAPCQNEDMTTNGGGKRNLQDCTEVPQMRLQPDFPRATPTQFSWWWYKYGTPDQDERTIDVHLRLEFAWRDERVARHPTLSRRLGRSVSEAQWRAAGMWLPSFEIHDADGNTTTNSEISTTVRALGGGELAVDCRWIMNLEPLTIDWTGDSEAYIDWSMFPFGEQLLRLKLSCSDGADCWFHDLTNGTGACQGNPEESAQPQEGEAQESNEEAASLRRLSSRTSSSSAPSRAASSGSLIAVSRLSADGDNGGFLARDADASSEFPLVRTITYTSPSSRQGSLNFFIDITMERMAVLYIVRLCVPLILVIFLSLYFFYVGDSYHQLDLSFNSLLLITLIGIEVKDFMPDHVVVVTWIDWFLLGNIVLVVFVTGLSLLIIVFEESDNPLVSCLADVLDGTVKRTQVYVATLLNMLLICMGYGRILGWSSPFSGDSMPSVIDVQYVIMVIIGADVVLCAFFFGIGASFKVREVRTKMKIDLALEVKREIEARALAEGMDDSEDYPSIESIETKDVKWY